jgi:hypothetical protein
VKTKKKYISRPGLYTYRIKQVDTDGKFTFSQEVTLLQNLRNDVALYPNPAKDMTNLSLQLASDANVSMQLYDDAGALVRQLKSSGVMEKGQHSEILNLQEIPSGVYHLKIEINGEQLIRKLVVID